MAAYLIDSCYATYSDVISVFAVVIFSAQSLADAFAALPNYSDARDAAARLFNAIHVHEDLMSNGVQKQWWERVDLLHASSTEEDLEKSESFGKNNGKQDTAQRKSAKRENSNFATEETAETLSCQLDSFEEPLINFRSVNFRYPARPRSKVLRSLELCVKRGSIHAIVGPSGSGKTTGE